MSDIHGEKEILSENFESIIKPSLMESKDNKLVLLGDYIARKERCFEILYYIKDIQLQFCEQIIVLKGNHDIWLYHDIKRGLINCSDNNIISWLETLPMYYETDTQIYVHAGIDEEIKLDWRHTSETTFCRKYPPTMGGFYKDIIAGHVSTSLITGDADYHKVYWDNESHFYIDGETEKSKVIPILKYDTKTKKYSSFEKKYNIDQLSEYTIK